MPIQVASPTPQPVGSSDTPTVSLVSVTKTTDDLGDTTETETTTDVSDWLFAPRSSTERADSKAPAVITGASLYGPAGSTIGPNDYFLVDGIRYDVEGEPGYWGSAGIEVAIKRTS